MDLLIEPAGRRLGPDCLVIECDGHDFHEKTKGQAKHDKERDRNLQLEGFRVMHFTGSEVFKDSDKCADQIMKMLEIMI